MLSSRRSWSRGIRQAPARLLALFGVRPNHVTVASLLFAAAAAFYLAQARWLLGGVLAVVASGLDFVDGELARLTNRVTPQGGYLDSLVDRAVDFLLLTGVMAGIDDRRVWMVGCAALATGLVTSYAKARAYEEKPIAKEAWRNSLIERPERYVILLPAIFVQAYVPKDPHSPAIMVWVLAALAALSLFTIFQRGRTAWRVLGESSTEPNQGKPRGP